MTSTATTTPSRFARLCRKHALALTTLVASMLATGAAAHAEDAKVTLVNGNSTYTETLSLADLDLSTASGKNMAEQRIHEAARKACLRAHNPDDRASRYTYLTCLDASVAAAGPKLQQLADANRRAHALAKN